MRSLVIVVGSAIACAGVALADPTWDWQNTYTFNALGQVTGITSDVTSSHWLSCSTNWAQSGQTSSSTLNQAHTEIYKLDTGSQTSQKVVQQSGTITTTTYTCTGSQTGLPSDTAPQCSFGLLTSNALGPCNFGCAQGGTLKAVIQDGVLATIRGRCPLTSDARCSSNPLSCEDDQTPIGLTGTGDCSSLGGIFLSGYCQG